MKHYRFSNWIFAIPLLLILAAVNGYVIYSSIQNIQKDASFVNIAGKIRGGIQKVSKLESNGINSIDDIKSIDRFFIELRSDSNHFNQNEADSLFVEDLNALQSEWNNLKSSIQNYHVTHDDASRYKIISISELCWKLANKTVMQVQISSEMKVSKIEKLLFLLFFDFVVFAIIARYVSILIRSIETKERDLLQKILDANPHIIALKDGMGRFSLVNQALANLYGTTKENMIGKDDGAFNPNTAQVAFFSKNIQDILQSGLPQTVLENSTDVNTGEVRNYESIKIPIINHDGSKNVLIIASDITMLKQSEQNLRKLLDEQEALLQIRTVGFIHVKNRRFLWTNEAFEQMLGYEKGELVDQFSRIIYAANEDYDYIGEVGYQTLSEHGIFTHEIKGLKKDGSGIDLIISLNAIENISDEVMGVVIDITQQKTLEVELMQAKELAEAITCSKSEFLANMSHEIRTPLNAIIGFVPILVKRITDTESKKYLDIIHKSGLSLLDIVNNILDFSKINSQMLKIESYAFNPCTEMEGIMLLFFPSAKEKEIDLLTFIDPNIPGCVKGDLTRIKQIVNNLLSNAIKFTPQNGTIRVKINYDIQNEMLECVIKDSGIGMSEEEQKKIFHPFEQSDVSITRKFGGSGLGLTICKSLSDLMGGNIQVTSQPQKGSTFHFKAPLPLCTERSFNQTKSRFTGARYYTHFDNKYENHVKLIKKYFESLGLEDVKSSEKAMLVLTDDKNYSTIQLPILYFSKLEDDNCINNTHLHSISSPILPSTMIDILDTILRQNAIEVKKD